MAGIKLSVMSQIRNRMSAYFAPQKKPFDGGLIGGTLGYIGNAVLITNGTTIPGGTLPSTGYPAQNSNFGLNSVLKPVNFR
jgi:hypothetical protein